MALPSTREGLKDWCLRKLGAPVLEVNVDNYQLEDRIDEAIQFFNDYHFDGVERLYMKHKVTGSILTFDAPLTVTFQVGEQITGSTSGAVGVVVEQATDNLSITFRLDFSETPDDTTFAAGETITGSITGSVATIGAGASSVTPGDIDLHYIETPNRILSVVNVFPISSTLNNTNLFSTRYEFAFSQMANLLSADLISYKMFKQHLALLDELFVGDVQYRHNRKQNRVMIDTDWNVVKVGDYVIFEVLASLDPNDWPEIWADEFLRDYTLELFRLQWAQNLIKYEGVQLPGGLTLNAERMYTEASDKLEKLRERVRNEFEEPPHMIVG